jgi:hypothetical protein
MQKLPGVSINNINTFNENVFYIKIKVELTSIDIETYFPLHNFYRRQQNVFFAIKDFFTRWIKKNPNFLNFTGPHNMGSFTDYSTFFTFRVRSWVGLGTIKDLTMQAVEDFIQDRNIPQDNFTLIDVDDYIYNNYNLERTHSKILRYKILLPKVAVSKYIRLNHLKELRF